MERRIRQGENNVEEIKQRITNLTTNIVVPTPRPDSSSISLLTPSTSSKEYELLRTEIDTKYQLTLTQLREFRHVIDNILANEQKVIETRDNQQSLLYEKTETQLQEINKQFQQFQVAQAEFQQRLERGEQQHTRSQEQYESKSKEFSEQVSTFQLSLDQFQRVNDSAAVAVRQTTEENFGSMRRDVQQLEQRLQEVNRTAVAEFFNQMQCEIVVYSTYSFFCFSAL